MFGSSRAQSSLLCYTQGACVVLPSSSYPLLHAASPSAPPPPANSASSASCPASVASGLRCPPLATMAPPRSTGRGGVAGSGRGPTGGTDGRADTRPSTATVVAARVCCGDNTGRPRTSSEWRHKHSLLLVPGGPAGRGGLPIDEHVDEPIDRSTACSSPPEAPSTATHCLTPSPGAYWYWHCGRTGSHIGIASHLKKKI